MSSDRRDFLKQLSLATVAVGGGAIISPLDAEELSRAADLASAPGGAWDMSWTEQVQRAQYKAVFDSTNLNDGSALDLAGDIQGNFKEVYGSDDVVRMVIIMRQDPTPTALYVHPSITTGAQKRADGTPDLRLTRKTAPEPSAHCKASPERPSSRSMRRRTTRRRFSRTKSSSCCVPRRTSNWETPRPRLPTSTSSA